MDFQDDSLRYLMKIDSKDNTYNYFEKEVKTFTVNFTW